MKTKILLPVVASCFAATLFADEWPLIVVRHSSILNEYPEVFEQLVAQHRRYPGACDEFWFCVPGRKIGADLERDCQKIARFRSLCDEIGVTMSFQQGNTLGHGPAPAERQPGDWPLADTDWQVDRHGKILRMVCPRSPHVLACEKEFTRTILSVVKPSTFWLDDDMRMGICKEFGCFCDRCLKAFNEQTKGNWTRPQLVNALFETKGNLPVRAQWIDFNAESLARFAAAVRAAADEVKSPCHLCYQAVWADTIYTGRDLKPLLSALAGKQRHPVGIRPGAGCYTEDKPREMVNKCLSAAREAERCRDYGFVGTVCYEQETYPRHVLHKSPGAIVVESALAIASGCDTVSEYWYVQSDPEPIADYGQFLKALSEAKPYFKRLSDSVRRTRLGGVARYIGARAGEGEDFDLRDPVDFPLACAGIPVTVAESGTKTWYLTQKSVTEMDEADWRKVAGGGVVVPEKVWQGVAAGKCAQLPQAKRIADFTPYPRTEIRAALLDALDAVTPGGLCVRLEDCRPIRILPRLRSDGTVDSVTLLNLSIGNSGALHLRIRRPGGKKAYWMGANGSQTGRDVDLRPGKTPDECVAVISGLSGWEIGTIFF